MSSNKYDYDIIVKRYVKPNKSSTIVLTGDDNLGKAASKELTDREKKYSKLLGDYLSLTKVRNILKEIHKWLFFWIVIVACVFICVLLGSFISQFTVSISKGSIKIESIATFISAVASLVSIVIAIPIVITKYLFNTHEDDNITEIIKNTQSHDNAEMDILSDHFKIHDLKEDNKPESTDDKSPIDEIDQQVEQIRETFEL